MNKKGQESAGKEKSQDQQEPNQENIADFIAVLEEHRKQCEQEGKYVEAEMAKNRIEELKHQEFQRRREELIFNQTKEREEVEQAHIMEYQEFNKNWDDTLAQIEAQDQQAIQALEEKHVRELEENRQVLEQKLPLTFKQSAELLNLRQIEQNLARQKSYAEAHQVQVKAQQLEEDEREKAVQARHKKIVAAEAKLIQKQQNEMNALRKKIEGAMNERLKQREFEHNKLLQRYQNVKKELENQHNIDRQKLEKQYATRPSTAMNRSQMNTSRMNSSKIIGKASQKPASKPSYQ
ncbi:UNKNOWN [Stylonychia lemnae]|uniref:Uncharacterized protein n=1 Tax=Stylonychia lemnae TaxID=5949 RepID=A0A077ZPT9_STYLE|nr:UNKNOWN [Stylonychia lemnae]|eukprot:CDW71390.1 UNKNOWN [Stylonychia lemnae]